MRITKIVLSVFFLLFLPSVLGATNISNASFDFTPSGNINMRNIWNITNLTKICDNSAKCYTLSELNSSSSGSGDITSVTTPINGYLKGGSASGDPALSLNDSAFNLSYDVRYAFSASAFMNGNFTAQFLSQLATNISRGDLITSGNNTWALRGNVSDNNELANGAGYQVASAAFLVANFTANFLSQLGLNISRGDLLTPANITRGDLITPSNNTWALRGNVTDTNQLSNGAGYQVEASAWKLANITALALQVEASAFKIANATALGYQTEASAYKAINASSFIMNNTDVSFRNVSITLGNVSIGNLKISNSNDSCINISRINGGSLYLCT